MIVVHIWPVLRRQSPRMPQYKLELEVNLDGKVGSLQQMR